MASEWGVLPEAAIMGLWCGNLTAIASLIAGEMVLDLGSDGRFDVFSIEVFTMTAIIRLATPEMMLRACRRFTPPLCATRRSHLN